MDLYCPTCSEPWDNDSLHEEADARKEVAPAPGTVGAVFSKGTSYAAVAADFRQRGCKALETAFGRQGHCTPTDPDRQMLAAIVYELAGDDMDGAASDFDDARRLGLI